MNKRYLAIVWAAATAIAGLGCDEDRSTEDEPFQPESAPTGSELGATSMINYRGRMMPGVRVGDQWFIEGDILVVDSDLGPSTDGPVQKANRGFDSSRNLKWPNNTIFYRFGDLRATDACVDAAGKAVDCNTRLSQAEYESTIRSAMRDWEAVSNVRFVEDNRQVRTDHVSIVGTNNRCASAVGRVGGSQLLQWSDRCSFRPSDGRRIFSTHHELGHAMGLWHEHQRSDRATFVNVLNNASSTDPVNYAIGGARVNAYDCGSIMHYSVNLSSKNDSSGTPLCNDMGQRDHFSTGDITAARVLYPTLAPRSFAFYATGSQRLCRLVGREEDANTRFEAWINGRSVSAPTTDSQRLPEGDHTLRCRARSCFWRSSYRYPATAVTAAGNTCGTNAEVFDTTVSLKVANPGLIAAIF